MLKRTKKGKLIMHDDINKVLFTKDDIAKKCAEIGAQLTDEYAGKFPLVIGVLKVATPFMADLSRHIDTHVEMDFMDVSSYGSDTRSSEEVKIVIDLYTQVEESYLLIIEDIIESGLTLIYLVYFFNYRKAKSVKIVTLLDKSGVRIVKIKVDIVGFKVTNEFVVGYGLDYDEMYRNLPYIGILKSEV